MNRATPNKTLEIRGTPFDSVGATLRIVLSAACLGLGIFLWPLREHAFWSTWDSPDAGAAVWLMAVIPWLIAAILPCKAHTFLDFANSQLVTLKYYGWLRISNCRRPLTDFGCIAVRHVCHPGGEGPDTFTGSVGLKPADGGAVFWLKEFSTTQDEMPREAFVYARRLKELLPLPMTVLGMEFLDLDQSKGVLPDRRNSLGTHQPTNPSRSTPSEMNRALLRDRTQR